MNKYEKKDFKMKLRAQLMKKYNTPEAKIKQMAAEETARKALQKKLSKLYRSLRKNPMAFSKN